ncbi:MAG: penicillin-binding protein 1B [Proteobacteria bacterium]|nr:MAG: penicillin-binding protein 1B [Pseudomonadota bacterium]
MVFKRKPASKKRSAKKRSAKKRRATKRGARVSRRRTRLLITSIATVIAVVGAVLAWLDYRLIQRFEQRHFAAPVRVYSAPMEWFPGSRLSPGEAVGALRALGYRQRAGRRLGAGDFYVNKERLELVTRRFGYAGELHPSRPVAVSFARGLVDGITDGRSGDRLPALRLEPVVIGSLDTSRHKDRRILRLHQIPGKFLEVLLLVEDRQFMTHLGINPVAIIRALFANIRSGRVTQGGSTITQQLVKNLYLSPEQTVTRKAKEALYALLLELHFDKHEILEAYVNEVFLAQAGNRAIHGFALGSEYFFGRPLADLEIQDFALLVGMVKEPSSFNPRRHPKRALDRRNVILDVLDDEGLIDPKVAAALSKKPLGVVSAERRGGQPYAAFLDLVRRQVHERGISGASEALELKVWSTLDPSVQRAAERELSEGLSRIERQRGLPGGTLQGAAVVLRAESGHVVALVGDRRPGFSGFNRALDASRPVGSLLKPVIALNALEAPGTYHLASLLEDKPFSLSLENGATWKPGNYDGEFHGVVTLTRAIEQSYNVASARLGVEIGVGAFVSRLESLGLGRRPPAYPSALLGAVDMSPLEVATVYLPFASGGLQFPVRAFIAATDGEGRVLSRNPAATRRIIQPDAHFLLHHLLEGVVKRGTAKAVLGRFGADNGLAGKTGTTDDYRDSWFAGYSENYLAVVWVGRDDNRPTGLSGSSGALPVWRDLMKALPIREPAFEPPAGAEWHAVDMVSGLRVSSDCGSALRLPFISGGDLPARGRCGEAPVPVPGNRDGGVRNWLERLFSTDSEQPHADWNEGGRR